MSANGKKAASICLPLLTILICPAAAIGDTDDATCQQLLEFAQSGSNIPPAAYTPDHLKDCAKKALDYTHSLRDAIKSATSSAPDKIPAGTGYPTQFLPFTADGDINTAILLYRRWVSILLDGLHGRWLSLRTGPLRSMAMKASRAKASGAKAGIESSLDEAKTDLEIANSVILDLMDQRNLLDPFNALLQTYLVAILATGNTVVPSALSGQTQSNQVKAAGFLDFESEHLHANSGIDFSFGGRFGVEPVQTLVTISPPPTTPSKFGVYTLYQNAFAWDLNARSNFRLGRRAELSLPVFRFGETILLDDNVSVSASPMQTATPIPNNRGKGAWFWEVAPEYRLYPKLLDTIEDTKKFLQPSFAFATGYRRDSRFNQNGQSGIPTEIEAFANPTKRWFLRSFVTLTKVTQRDFSATTSANPFDVSIGVEWDTVWGKSGGKVGPGVPDGTKIFINASIDLVKAFTKQGTTAAPANPSGSK